MAKAAELEQRLSNLEDKIKRNFFEVEKRLSSIEVSPKNVEERVKEVEDLQMLSQLEIMKLKEGERQQPIQAQTVVVPPDTEKKIIDLLHRVDALESQKITDKSASYFIS